MKKLIYLALLLSLAIGVRAQSPAGAYTSPSPGSSSGGGTGSTTNPASPVLAMYLSNACPATNTGQCFFTQADSQLVSDCTWTNASTTVSCASAHFSTADVGKFVMGNQNCAADTNAVNTVNGAISTTALVQITGFTDSQHVVLSSTPANSATATSCFLWGHKDDSGASTLDTAAQAANQCAKIELAASYYLWESPHFFTNPTACQNLPTELLGGFGNVILPAGYTLEGRLPGTSTVFLAPSFPNGDSCVHKPEVGMGGGGCFAIALEGTWRGLMLTGLGQYQAPNMANKTLLSSGIGNIDHVMCVNLGAFTSGAVGLNAGPQVMIDEYDNSGCGTIGIQTDSLVAGNNTWHRAVVEDSSSNALFINGGAGADIACYWCNFSLPQNGLTTAITVVNAGGNLRMFGGDMLSANFFPSTNTGIIIYKDQGPGTLYMDSTVVNNGTSTGNAGLFCSVSGCVISAFNGTKYIGPSGTAAYADSGGGKFYLDSTFIYNGPFSNNAITGSIIADGHQALGICTGTATASSTLALNLSGISTTGTGITSACTSATLDKGVTMPQARTISAMICTSTATTVSVACKILVNGTPNATFTCTMTAATECHDFTHTVSVNKGDLVSMEIVSGAAETGANIKEQILWQ